MSTDRGSCGNDQCGCGSGSVPAESGDAILERLEQESGFHPMGKEWEDDMRAMLEDTDFDAELGMQMARDAMRLTAGEITEEAFYEKYNEAVIQEFGEDDRPMVEQFVADPPEDESLVDALKSLTDTDVSRRDTMKKGAFAAGAIGLGGLLPNDRVDSEDDAGGRVAQTNTGNPNTDVRYGMVIDLDRCDGCLECVVGCMNENGQDTGANWMYVMSWEDQDTEQQNFLVRPCQHCSNAPCAKVCPVQARHIRDNDGLVLTNYETCIGCRYCQVACPYGVNYFQWGHPQVPREELMNGDHDLTGPELRDMSEEERVDLLQDSGDHIHDYRGWEVDSRGQVGTMGKCTFCPSRQDGNMGDDWVGTVACADACDDQGMSAIHFGDLNDPDSRPNRYIERAREMSVSPEDKQEQLDDADEFWETPEAPHHTSQLSAFRLLEEVGTQPNIIYLGNEPGPNAEQIDGPVTYDRLTTEDGRQVVDARKDVTDELTDFGAMGDD